MLHRAEGLQQSLHAELRAEKMCFIYKGAGWFTIPFPLSMNSLLSLHVLPGTALGSLFVWVVLFLSSSLL